MNVEKLVGNWSPLLQHEFDKDYLKVDISKEITSYRNNPFSGICKGDPFQHFKNTPLDKLKCIFIVNTLKSVKGINYQIEKELFDGFSLLLSNENDVEWLNKQGIMIFPRYLTWDSEKPHTVWEPFTNKVIELIISTNKDILIVNDDQKLEEKIKTLTPNYISSGKYVWKAVQSYVKEHFEEEVVWEPLPF